MRWTYPQVVGHARSSLELINVSEESTAGISQTALALRACLGSEDLIS